MEVWNTIVNAFKNENFGTLLQAAAIFCIGLIIIKIIMVATRHMLSRSRIDSVLYSFVQNSIKVLCLMILIITVLGYVGVPTSTFVTVIAAAGAAIALAIKDTLGNFAGGLLIILNKPFSKGDFIECSGVTGKVQQIDLMYSRLQTFDNKLISMPNAILANSFLVKKVVFRVSLLPIVQICSALVVSMFFHVVLFLMFAVYGYPPSIYNLQVFYYLFALICLVFGLSLITSSLVIFLKDIGQLVGMLLQFLFWGTPIFWSLSMIPSGYQWFFKMNPLYYIIEGYRRSFISHEWFWTLGWTTIGFWLVTIVVVLAGAAVFHRLRPHFADVL